MLAETVGWSTGAPSFSSSRSICQSSSRKRFRFLGSRTSSSDGAEDGAPPTKYVSACPFPGRRGCGAAEPEYRRSMTLRPQEPFTYKKLGTCLVELNRFDEAAQLFARLEEVDPHSPDGPTGLAMVAMALGRSEDSRTRLHEAISRDPSPSSPAWAVRV